MVDCQETSVVSDFHCTSFLVTVLHACPVKIAFFCLFFQNVISNQVMILIVLNSSQNHKLFFSSNSDTEVELQPAVKMAGGRWKSERRLYKGTAQ